MRLVAIFYWREVHSQQVAISGLKNKQTVLYAYADKIMFKREQDSEGSSIGWEMRFSTCFALIFLLVEVVNINLASSKKYTNIPVLDIFFR
jgi:hypothetical protein